MSTTAAVKSKTDLEPLPTGIRKFENPIPFVEEFKWSDLDATFTAASYTAWMEAALPIIKTLEPTEKGLAQKHGVKIGDKIFYLRQFPMWFYASTSFGFFSVGKLRPCRGTLEVWRGRTERSICFDDVVSIPVLADEKLEPWMSLTPNEVFTLRGQIRRAKKNSAMAGLGLGWAARKVLERKQVNHLTVYEKDQNLIDYFGKSLIEDFGDRLTIVCCDAYEVDWMKHDVALWDIWKGLGDAAYDSKYKAIRQKMQDAGKVCVGWGEGLG